MNIRKHWKHLLLSSTALFWASCGSDSESTPVAGGIGNEAPITPDSVVNPNNLDGIKIDTLYGIKPVYNADTGAVSSADISKHDSTSVTEEVQSSSSDNGPAYKLASNPNVTCKMTETHPLSSCIEFVTTSTPKSSEPSAQDLMKQLEKNTTKTLEELNKIEEQLENTPDFSEVALYGVQMPSCLRYNFKETFKCTNDSTYTTYADDSGTHVLKGNTIYTKEELKSSSSAKVAESSSSAEPESSSSVEPPSPLCTKSDFANSSVLFDQFLSDKDAQVDSAKATIDTTALDSLAKRSLKKCLESVNAKSSAARIDGRVAKKQTCDGETIVNPRYQAKLDSNKAYVNKQVDECLAKDD